MGDFSSGLVLLFFGKHFLLVAPQNHFPLCFPSFLQGSTLKHTGGWYGDLVVGLTVVAFVVLVVVVVVELVVVVK